MNDAEKLKMGEWVVCVRLAAQKLASGNEPAATIPDLVYAICNPLMEKWVYGKPDRVAAREQAENQMRRQIIRETVMARHGIAPP